MQKDNIDVGYEILIADPSAGLISRRFTKKSTAYFRGPNERESPEIKISDPTIMIVDRATGTGVSGGTSLTPIPLGDATNGGVWEPSSTPHVKRVDPGNYSHFCLGHFTQSQLTPDDLIESIVYYD